MKQLEKLLNIWNMLDTASKLQRAEIDYLHLLLDREKNSQITEELRISGEAKTRYLLLMKKIEAFINHLDIRGDTLANRSTQVCETNVVSFLEKVKNYKGDDIVFIFSGTAHIQKVKGNRPIRLALEFEKQKTPVIFSYWRWKSSEPLPQYQSDYLVQLPIDETMKQLMEVIRAPISQKNKVFIFEFPYPPASKYLELFKFYGWKVIYDIRDDWEEFEKVGQAKWYDQAHEIYAIETADATVAVSKALTEKFESLTNRMIQLLPNALDTNFKLESNYEARRKIGYIGHLTASWFDWESLIYIAKALPYYTFEIIGHSLPVELPQLPNNLIYLGPKDFDEMKKYVASWRVGIIPFKINKLTKAVDPIKVYEYLSMGLKVVSFDMPQMLDYPEVKLAHTREAFIRYIEVCMREPYDYQKVNMFLEKNTWSERVKWIKEWVRK